MKKILFLFSFMTAAAFFSTPILLADDTTSGGSTYYTTREISEKQDKILQALDEIKAELNIIKIRVSSS